LVGLEEEIAVPAEPGGCTSLPNPCVFRTRLSFDLPAGTGYRIAIYDVTGRHVRDIIGQARRGDETVYWDCRDRRGIRVSAGVYPYCLESSSGKFSGTILVR